MNLIMSGQFITRIKKELNTLSIKEFRVNLWYILITVVDDIFPILAIEEMMNSITYEDYDFISGTRYSLGGKRIGGSLLGSILSRTATKIFQIITKFPFSDSTTGIKMMKKKYGKILV